MLSRRSVRIKAMQFLFSLSRDEDLKFDEAAKRFWSSIETTYDLYMYNLYLLMEVTKCAYQDAENRKTKHLPSAYDKKFTAKIDTNPLMNSLSENSELSKEFKKRNKRQNVRKISTRASRSQGSLSQKDPLFPMSNPPIKILVTGLNGTILCVYSVYTIVTGIPCLKPSCSAQYRKDDRDRQRKSW